MHETASTALESWANFYVIVGSSAAGLTGLQFVVLTLTAQIRGLRGREESISAFGSPNVVHFSAALLVAAILSAPWHTYPHVGVPVSACGVAGVYYSVLVLIRAHRQRGYQPVLEDWVWHTILPFLAYGAITVAGAALAARSTGALFVIGGAELLLLFIGIHNSWDTVTYLTILQAARERAEDAERAAEQLRTGADLRASGPAQPASPGGRTPPAAP